MRYVSLAVGGLRVKMLKMLMFFVCEHLEHLEHLVMILALRKKSL